MEDLIPFLIFVVIAVVNLLKFAAQKSGKSKKTPAAPQRDQAPKQPSSLEGFFEDLARKLEPKPIDQPDWPEDRERPDYMKEMEAFEDPQPEAVDRKEKAEIIPMPTAAAEPKIAPPEEVAVIPGVQPMDQARSLQSALKSMPVLFSGGTSIRFPASSMHQSTKVGRIDFPLKEKADLRKAIIANIVFGPPRAYDASFENTVMK